MKSKEGRRNPITKRDLSHLKSGLLWLKQATKADLQELEQATRKDIKKLEQATSNLDKRLTAEVRCLDKKVDAMEFSLRRAIIFTAQATKEEIKEELKEEFKEMRMDILGVVADFAKRTTDVELAQNLLSARVENHEDRLVKIENKSTPHE